MVTSTQQQAQEKGLLQKMYIRTMRKDIKQLRETDSLKEREKINKINPATSILPPEAEMLPPEAELLPPEKFPTQVNPAQPDLYDNVPLKAEKTPAAEPSLLQSEIKNPLQDKQNEATSEVIKDDIPSPQQQQSPAPEQDQKVDQMLQQIAGKSLLKKTTDAVPLELAGDKLTEIKKYADENEKQQIFLLQSQKQNLENQLKDLAAPSEDSLILEKNNILLEQKNWQKKLAPVIQEEKENEAEQNSIEDKEVASKIPQEKQGLEKQRWALEDKMHDIEKKRWLIESELAKLEDKVKNLHETGQAHTATENSLQQGIAKINNSLQAIYDGIAKRENIKKEELQKPSIEKIQIDSKQKDQAERQNKIKSNELQEKEYFRKIPVAAKEKLASSAVVEEKQRRKFIEDVEKWAEEEKKRNSQ